MSLQSLYDLALGSTSLRQRFLAARIKAAFDVVNEGAGAPDHAVRLVWANGVLTAPGVSPEREYLDFLSNPTIQTTGPASTDSDIQFVVNSFVAAWAAEG